MELNGYYRLTVNSKAFAIPILTEFAFIMIDTIAVKIRKANALELTFILQQSWSNLQLVYIPLCSLTFLHSFDF